MKKVISFNKIGGPEVLEFKDIKDNINKYEPKYFYNN